MKVIPEEITVLADPAQSELTILMEGFRFSLTAEEALALTEALLQGMRQLDKEAPDFAATLPDRLTTVDRLQQNGKQVVEMPPAPDARAGGNAFTPLIDTLRRRQHERRDTASPGRP